MSDVSPSRLEFQMLFLIFAFIYLFLAIVKNDESQTAVFSHSDECSTKKLSDVTGAKKGVKAKKGTDGIKNE